MQCSPLENVVASAEAEGVRLWAQGGGIHYRSPSSLSVELRELIVANKAELLARLEAWNQAEAIRLMHAADGTVGCLGMDAEIQSQAARCAGAATREDMTGVRSACALIENRVRMLTNQQRKEAA